MRLLFFAIVVFVFSCSHRNDEHTVVLASHPLKDNATLILQIDTGSFLGATIPSVTWINVKYSNGKERQVGKINRWLNKGSVSFNPINDTIVNLHYVDSIWSHEYVYSININHRISSNDGSPYIQPK